MGVTMQIQIPREVFNKIMHWVNKSNDEVSGFGKCTYYKETGVLYVHDAYLLKQTNGAAHTDIDGQSLARLMYKTREEEGELKWWWHSHVNMQVFWSGTDTATIKELASQGWIGATVFNKREEMRSAIGVVTKSDILGDEVLIRDELPTYIMDEVDEEATKAWDQEYTENVQEKKYTYSNSYYSNYDAEDLTDWREKQGNTRYNYPKDSPVTLKAERAEDWEYYKNFGWTGAGASAEAKVLGIHYQAWMKMLMQNDVKVYDAYDKILDAAIAAGELKPRKELE